MENEMKFEYLQYMIDRVRGKKYIKTYKPYYNEHVDISPKVPDVYNKDGRKMDFFFIRDRHCSTSPYGTFSKYFLWDRFNIGLKTHFYSNQSLIETMGKPVNKYGVFFEPKSKTPKDYDRILNNKGLAAEFDAIFTYDERLLEKLPNAKLFPSCAGCWVNVFDETLWQKKTKQVSILSSHKRMCHLHDVRLAIARKCKKEGLADTYGTFDGGSYVDMYETLREYRYHIAIENDVSPYFFTERLISSLITQTVPIYLGASKIGDFFNTDGIIQITEKDVDNIETILKKCTPEDYAQRLPAIKDNYRRALEYVNLDDWLYEKYFLNKEYK